MGLTAKFEIQLGKQPVPEEVGPLRECTEQNKGRGYFLDGLHPTRVTAAIIEKAREILIYKRNTGKRLKDNSDFFEKEKAESLL